jgi:hypothetical protein
VWRVRRAIVIAPAEHFVALVAEDIRAVPARERLNTSGQNAR